MVQNLGKDLEKLCPECGEAHAEIYRYTNEKTGEFQDIWHFKYCPTTGLTKANKEKE